MFLADTGPKSRVNFSAGSQRALEPRERVLSTLKELLQIEREKRQIQGVCNPPTESVKMCRTCFGRYEKCYNLAAQHFPLQGDCNWEGCVSLA